MTCILNHSDHCALQLAQMFRDNVSFSKDLLITQTFVLLFTCLCIAKQGEKLLSTIFCVSLVICHKRPLGLSKRPSKKYLDTLQKNLQGY